MDAYRGFNPNMFGQQNNVPYGTGAFDNMRRMEVVKVNGKNGADAFQMPPNSSALLLDETQPIVWLVQTDGAGYKSSTPYKISLYEPEPPVDLKKLEERLGELERVVANYESNVSTANEQQRNKQFKQSK